MLSQTWRAKAPLSPLDGVYLALSSCIAKGNNASSYTVQHECQRPRYLERCLFAFYWLQGTSWQKWRESSAVHTTCGKAPRGWRGPWGWEGWGVSVQKQVLSFQPAASPSHLSTFSHVSSSLIAQVDSASPRQEYLWGYSAHTPAQPGQ